MTMSVGGFRAHFKIDIKVKSGVLDVVGNQRESLEVNNIWELLAKIENIDNKTSKQYESLREEMTAVREVLNNGIVSATKANTKAIENLKDIVVELNTCVATDEAEKEGKKTALKVIIGIVSGIGSGIVTTLTILYQLGVL
jgi:hypothetical protein